MLCILPGISSLLISTLPVHSPAFFPKTSPKFFPVLAVANTGSCVGLQNKIGHLAGCMFPCLVPAEYKKAKKTREMNKLVIACEVFVQP